VQVTYYVIQVWVIHLSIVVAQAQREAFYARALLILPAVRLDVTIRELNSIHLPHLVLFVQAVRTYYFIPHYKLLWSALLLKCLVYITYAK